MACNCSGSEVDCIKVNVNPCDDGIPLGINSVGSGSYTVLLAGPNVNKRFILSMGADEEIVLPNEINNNYAFEMQILDPNGDLLNHTCYTLKTVLTLGSSNSIHPSPQPGGYKLITIVEESISNESKSYTNSWFATHTVIEIDTNNQVYIRDTDFTQSGSTITWINDNKFYDGQTILAQA